MAKSTPAEPCPNIANHTKSPDGYIAWHNWAASMHYFAMGEERDQAEGLAVAQPGHTLIADPSMSGPNRWTCATCGYVVLDSGSAS